MRTLLGNTSRVDLIDPVEKVAEASLQCADSDTEALSLVRLRAPFDGTIERRLFSNSERVDGGSAILTLADTATLWVAADLREREWSALELKPGDAIRVTLPVAGTKSVAALVHFVGREVDPQTNAVPLIAVIDNADGRLRPGMSVRVSIPLSAARSVLVVPESAVLTHDGQTFVFVSDGSSVFHRTSIQAGQVSSGQVEVVSGLDQGQQVVSGGAFYLKSELLLQSKEE